MRSNLIRALAVVAVTALALLPAAAHDGSTGPATASCTATAPTTQSCTTGAHIRVAGVSHGVCNPTCAGYTGVLISSLEYSNGARVFTCVVNNGAVAACNGQGSFPAPGVSFTHNCTAAGAGTYSCIITHS